MFSEVHIVRDPNAPPNSPPPAYSSGIVHSGPQGVFGQSLVVSTIPLDAAKLAAIQEILESPTPFVPRIKTETPSPESLESN